MKLPKDFVVWCSGGKDSIAQGLKLIELGYRGFPIIFIDTGIEWEQMYDYIENRVKPFFKKYGCKIYTYRSQYTWSSYFYKIKQKGNRKGEIYGFPFTIGAWCNDRLKGEAIKQAKKDFTGYLELVGYAIDEKSKLRQLKIQNKLKGINKFTTTKNIKDKKTGKIKTIIINHDITNEEYLLCRYNMTEKDCLEFTKKYNLYNPLYDEFGRTGCWCCPKQPLKSLEIIYNNYPKKWEQLKQWQLDSPRKFKPQYSIFELEEKFIKNASQKDKKVLGGNGIPPTSKEVGILPKII